MVFPGGALVEPIHIFLLGEQGRLELSLGEQWVGSP